MRWFGSAVPIRTWSDLLNASFIHAQIWSEAHPYDSVPDWAKKIVGQEGEVLLIQVEFQREGQRFTYFCPLDRLPLEELVPSVFLVLLKM